MKHLLFFLFVTVFFLSCSRDPNAANNSPSIEDGSVQYKVNGNLVTIKNISVANGEYILFGKHLAAVGLPSTRYTFNGQKGANNELLFGIVSDSLSTGNYTYDSTYMATSGIMTMVAYNGQISNMFYAVDNFIINVTAYSNGYASGDFTGKLTPIGSTGSFDYSKRGTTLITEGQFKNVKCIY